MSSTSSKTISGKTVLVLFLVTNAVLAFMLSITMPQVREFADGFELLDMLPGGYEVVYVQQLFDTLGEEGRNAYLTRQLPLDMIYPGLFAISYALVMAWFLTKLRKIGSWMIILVFLPVVAGFADYLENIGIITMLLSYPDQTEMMVSLTSLASVTKAMTTTVYFVALIVIVIAFGYQKMKSSKA